MTIVACLETGQYAELAALATPRLLATEFGIDEGSDVSQALALPPFAVTLLGNAQTHSEGQWSIEIRYRREQGQHMLVHERWFFVAQGERLLLDMLEPLPIAPEGPSTIAEVRINDSTCAVEPDRFVVGETILFQVSNAGTQRHAFEVFRPSEGRPANTLQQEPIPEGSEFIGAVSSEPGQGSVTLALVDLEAGVYVMACRADVFEENAPNQHTSLMQFHVVERSGT